MLNNSVLKEISENSKNNIESSKIKSVIEEKRSVESNDNKEFKDFAKNKCENKTFNQTQHINISIQAAPNQDVRSLADEVIKRIREKSRDVLFDTMDSIY